MMADIAESHERAQEKVRRYMTEHYRKLVRSYFADITEQGQIDKRARFEECEFLMKQLYQFSEDEILDIYDQEYRMYCCS
ncbi:MAG: hypothetical protein LKG80_02875 [Lachnospiraceae bacterium]|jgi:hypothetical protein|nr:hypothetical protein [Lachnospiraceae bacterium]MCH4108809.1 hypothetical protein [Lachnospiraceae bacterium]MCI1380097.1 hypothetical protein [Lachnospiraceae bacterium]MCI1555242.1 hypothetical protein [Lachnospiraceae bacterium]